MKSRAGTVILALLVVIMLGGVLATRLIPSYEIQQKRQDDTELKFSLAQIRQAFDLKLREDPTYSPVLTTPGAIKVALQGLKDENLLGEVGVNDSTIANYKWDSQAEFYWVGVGNVASNTGFEDDNGYGFLATWTLGTADTTIATESNSFSNNLDDYNGQNKLGNPFSTVNTVLKITK